MDFGSLPLAANKVRFDKEQHEKLLRYCEEHNITRTEAIRQGVHLLLAQDK